MSKALKGLGVVAGVVAFAALSASTFGVGGAAAAAALKTVATAASLAATAPSPGAPLQFKRPEMTAINAFMDNEFAYLATDGAAYNVETGRVAGLGSKVVLFREHRLVLAVSGKLVPESLVAAIDEAHSQTASPTQASLLAAVPRALRLARAELARNGAAEALGRNVVGVWAAFYDGGLHSPRIMSIMTPGFPGNDRQPYEWQELDGWMMPALSPVDQAKIFPRGYTEWPRIEMRRALQMQRAKVVAEVHGGCGVGGTCHLIQVGANGIAAQELVRFPEQIGDRLDPELSGAPLSTHLDDMRAV